jgi:myo-inositol 2-dehydrogenase / D-chiro-inositol 1-dehydrogenase
MGLYRRAIWLYLLGSNNKVRREQKMSDKLRVGVIGTGMMGFEHINNLKLMPEVEITAFADPTPRMLAKAHSMLGNKADKVTLFEDGAALVNSGKVDAVLIASPNHTHADVLTPIFETDLHVLCEKPLCTTPEDAARIAQRADQHKGVFWVGMEYRFMPPAARFISRVHGGDVGRLIMVSIREHRFPFLNKVDDWNRFSANTGGTMVEKCCHFFDLMRNIIQSEPTRVYCSGNMDVNHQDERYNGVKPDILDNSFTVVDFANGTRAMLDLCMFADGAEHQEEISATGDQARLDVLIPPGELVLSRRVGRAQEKDIARETIEVDKTALEAGSHFGATFYQQRAWLDAILNGGPVQVTAYDGLQAVRMGAAAERSAKSGLAVEMKDVAGGR